MARNAHRADAQAGVDAHVGPTRGKRVRAARSPSCTHDRNQRHGGAGKGGVQERGGVVSDAQCTPHHAAPPHVPSPHGDVGRDARDEGKQLAGAGSPDTHVPVVEVPRGTQGPAGPTPATQPHTHTGRTRACRRSTIALTRTRALMRMRTRTWVRTQEQHTQALKTGCKHAAMAEAGGGR